MFYGENMRQKMQFFTIKPRIFPSKLKNFLPKLKNPANPFVGVAEKSVKKSLGPCGIKCSQGPKDTWAPGFPGWEGRCGHKGSQVDIQLRGLR